MEKLVVEEVEDQHEAASQAHAGGHEAITGGVGIFGVAGTDAIVTEALHQRRNAEHSDTPPPLTQAASVCTVDSTVVEIGDVQQERKEEAVLDFLDRLDKESTPLHTPSDGVATPMKHVEDDLPDTPSYERRGSMQEIVTPEGRKAQFEAIPSTSPAPEQRSATDEQLEAMKQVEMQEQNLETSVEDLRKVPPKSAAQLVERCFQLPPAQFTALYADPRPRHFISPKNMPPSPFAALRDIFQQREALEEERKKLQTATGFPRGTIPQFRSITSLREELRQFLQRSEWHKDEIQRRLMSSHTELSLSLTQQELAARCMHRSASTDPTSSRIDDGIMMVKPADTMPAALPSLSPNAKASNRPGPLGASPPIRARSTDPGTSSSEARLPDIGRPHQWLNSANVSGASPKRSSPTASLRKRLRTSSMRPNNSDSAETWETRGRACGEGQTTGAVKLLLKHLAAWRGGYIPPGLERAMLKLFVLFPGDMWDTEKNGMTEDEAELERSKGRAASAGLLGLLLGMKIVSEKQDSEAGEEHEADEEEEEEEEEEKVSSKVISRDRAEAVLKAIRSSRKAGVNPAQPADSVGWADYCTFLRKIARLATAFVPQTKVAEQPEVVGPEDHKPAVTIDDGEELAPMAEEAKGRQRRRSSAVSVQHDRHGNRMSTTGHSECRDHPTKEEFEEVKQLFRWFQAPCDVEYCDLPALTSALYMTGFSHRAVSSLIQDAREAAKKNADPEKRDKIARVDFAAILAKFRRQTEPARSIPVGLSNMVRVIVVQGGASEATEPALRVLGNRVIPYLVDLAVEMGGILEFESVQLKDYMQYVRQSKSGPTQHDAWASQQKLDTMHSAMTAQELLAYASGECRTACKHVWFLFLIDEHITAPCLPDVCSEDHFESIQDFMRGRGLDSELLNKCYELDTCMNPDQYRLVIDDLGAIEELHTAVFSASSWEMDKHLWRPAPAYRVLTEAFDLAPVFVVVREDCADGVLETKSPAMLRLDKEVLTRVQDHSLLWYRLGPEVKRRNRKQEEQAQNLSNKMRKVGRRIAMLGSLSPRQVALGSPVEAARAGTFKPASAESTESGKLLSPLGKPLGKTTTLDMLRKGNSPIKPKQATPAEQQVTAESLSKWGEMLEHDVYASVSSLVASTMSETESFTEQKIHETHIRRIHFLVEGDRQNLIHPQQDYVARSMVQYLMHTVDDMRQKEPVASIPLKLESRVQEGLRCMRNATEHRAQFWSFPSEETDFQIILDPALAQETMLGHSMQVKQQASGVMKQEWQAMTWPERLAVVQVVAEYQRLLATLDSLKPVTPSNEVKELRKDAPVFVIGPPGSGRSAALAKALKSSVTTKQFMTSSEVEIAPAADGQVSGICFLRVVGASTKSMDGRSLLRSLVLQIREHMEPEQHLHEAIPGALVQLEEELLTSLPMATANCPLVLVIDGLDKLAPNDPILTLRWVPKKLTSNVRIVITATEDILASGACAGFEAKNIIHLDSPSQDSASLYVKEFFAISHRQPEPEDVATMMQVYSIAPSLHVLGLCCNYARHWSNVPRLRAAHARYRALPLFASNWDNLELNPDYFSHTAMALLSMLVLARHGLSELHMRLAVALLTTPQRDSGLASPAPGSPLVATPLGRSVSVGIISRSSSDPAGLPDMSKTWDIKASSEFAAIRWLVTHTVAGKSSLMQLSDPMVANAVRNSDYFQMHKREICEAVIAVISSPSSAKSIPVYQQAASLPALQMQLASTTGVLPVQGHGGVGWTLLSAVFIRTKIEAGLLEDLIRDFQECLQGSQAGLFAVAEETTALLCQRLQSINYNLDWFVKPFHWGLFEQLIKKDDAATTSSSGSSPQPTSELEAMWTNLDEDEEDPACKFIEHPRPAPRVECTLRLPHRKAICSCDVFSSPSCIRYAVGFEDGQVMVWDGLFGEVDRVLDTGEASRVLACKFVQGPSGGSSSSSWKATSEMVPRYLVCATSSGKVVGFSHGAWKADFVCPLDVRKLGSTARFASSPSAARPETSKSRYDRSSSDISDASPMRQGASPLVSREPSLNTEQSAQAGGMASPMRRSSAVEMLKISGSVAQLSSHRRGSAVGLSADSPIARTESLNRRGSAVQAAVTLSESPIPKFKKQFPPAGLNALSALRRPSSAETGDMPFLPADERAAPLTCLSTSCLLNDAFLVAAGAQNGDIQIWLYREVVTPDGGLTRSCTCGDVKRLHTASVNCIAFAPDRWCMVSASSDKTIRLWTCDIDSGHLSCVEVLEQGSPCFWCEFDGQKMHCSGFGFIRQFDVKSMDDPESDSDWEFDESRADQPGNLTSMAVRARGSVHFGGPPQTKSPTKSRTNTPLQRMNSVLGKSLDLQRTDSSKHAQAEEPTFDPPLSSGEKVLLTVRASKLDNCVRMAGGDLMMVCCDNTMMVWDMHSDNAQSLELSARTTCCAGSRDGKIVLVASEDHNLRSWEMNEKRMLHSSWEQRRASGHRAEALRRADSTAMKRSEALGAPGRGSEDVSSQNVGDVPVEGVPVEGGAHRLKMPQQATGLIKSEASLNCPVTSISISHDGLIALSVGEGKAELWDMQSGSPSGTLGFHSDFGQVRQAAFCPAVAPTHVMHEVSNSLFLVVWSTHRINLWRADMLTTPVLAVGIHELDIRVAKFVGKDPMIVTGSLDKSVRVWRIQHKGKREKGEEDDASLSLSFGAGSGAKEQSEGTDRISVEMLGAARAQKFARTVSERVRSRCCLHGMHDDSVLNVAGETSGRYIASASADRSLAVFDLEHQTDKPLWRGVHMAYVQGVEFSRSGTFLASVGGDRVCRVWNVANGECTGIFKASGALTKVCFSPCETFVAAGGLAGSLGVWEVATGKPAPGRPHPVMCNMKCSVTSLSWIPGSLGLLGQLVAGTDGEVWGWDVSRGAFIGGFVNKSPANHGDGQREHFENPGITCAQLVVTDKLSLPELKATTAGTSPLKRSNTNARLKRGGTTKRPTDFLLQPQVGTAVLACGDIRGQVHIVMAPGLETGRASKPSGRHKHFHHHHHTHNVKHDVSVDPLHYLEKRKKSGAIALVLKTAIGIRGQLKQASKAAAEKSKTEAVAEETNADGGAMEESAAVEAAESSVVNAMDDAQAPVVEPPGKLKAQDRPRT